MSELIEKDKVIKEIDAIEEIWSTGQDGIKKACDLLRSTISKFPAAEEVEAHAQYYYKGKPIMLYYDNAAIEYLKEVGVEINRVFIRRAE